MRFVTNTRVAVPVIAVQPVERPSAKSLATPTVSTPVRDRKSAYVSVPHVAAFVLVTSEGWETLAPKPKAVPVACVPLKAATAGVAVFATEVTLVPMATSVWMRG